MNHRFSSQIRDIEKICLLIYSYTRICLADDEFKRAVKMFVVNLGLCVFHINPLVASVIPFSILLWLTPDDFTRQWETSWPPEG